MKNSIRGKTGAEKIFRKLIDTMMTDTMTRIKSLTGLTVLLFALSCSRYPEGVEQALKLAGDNRAELEQVLQHYRENKAEPLKYQAACFLIENMPGRYSEDDRPVKDYDLLFERWAEIQQGNREYVVEEESDSLALSLGLVSARKRLPDVNGIKSGYLIRNIDRSFEVWTSMPWGKDIPFEAFCEEILPYRLSTETLEDWRDLVIEQYRPLYDSLRQSHVDAVTACRLLFEAMGLEWDSINKMSLLLPAMNYSMINRVRTGPCTERVKYGIYAMRAFGIPVAWDYTPQWPFRSLGHDWTSVRDRDGKYIPFIPAELKPGEPHKPDHKMAKAYRHTWAIQPQSPVCIFRTGDVPGILRNVRMRDVSALTFPAADVSFPRDALRPDVREEYVCLAVFDDRNWVPLHWAKTADPVVFTDMGKDIVYLPVKYAEGVVSPCGTPLLFTPRAEIQWLKADTTRSQALKLIRKHPFLANWHVKMAGGQFQAANRADFSDAVTLHTVEHDPDFYFCHAVINDPGSYRYYRYLSPVGGKGHLAELEFYAGTDSVRITGKVTGVPGAKKKYPERTIDKVFDGDVLTFYDSEHPDVAWVGMDFGRKERVTKIRYLPRNDDNIIVPGQRYELFYWGDAGWVSLGKQTAADYALYCDRAPLNALFLLRNLTKGKEERIFTYENEKQIWW
jgi:hypothetical protein